MAGGVGSLCGLPWGMPSSTSTSRGRGADPPPPGDRSRAPRGGRAFHSSPLPRSCVKGSSCRLQLPWPPRGLCSQSLWDTLPRDPPPPTFTQLLPKPASCTHDCGSLDGAWAAPIATQPFPSVQAQSLRIWRRFWRLHPEGFSGEPTPPSSLGRAPQYQEAGLTQPRRPRTCCKATPPAYLSTGGGEGGEHPQGPCSQGTDPGPSSSPSPRAEEAAPSLPLRSVCT